MLLGLATPPILRRLNQCKVKQLWLEIKEFSEIAGYLRAVILPRAARAVLLDVGGYGSEIAAMPAVSKKLEFIVEETNNGLWQYQSIALQCPVIDVASIENKSVENAFVGRRIVDGAYQFFFESGIPPPGQDYVVIGFGGIGQCVCSALALRGINASVVELNERKLAVAEALGHRVGRLVDCFADARVIIGCTGVSSVTLGQLAHLTERPFLISGSSKNVEFGDVLIDGVLSPMGSKNALIEQKTGAVIVNNGLPINFHYGSLNNETSDFMFANLTAAMIEGTERRGGKIFKLSEEWQTEICRM